MGNFRIFVEKKEQFRVEAQSLRSELNTNLNLSIESLRLVCVYDLFGFDAELVERARYGVFGEIVTDRVTDEIEMGDDSIIAIEYLPGQFDQRAASAVDCVKLLDPEADVRIKSARLLVIDGGVEAKDIERIKRYCINAVESREKDMSKLTDAERAVPTAVPILEGFCAMSDEELAPYCKSMGLAMSAEDLAEVRRYFTEEGREPSETELRILDTYWSDHCRHTTFTSELTDIEVAESFISADIEAQLDGVLRIREELGRSAKPYCLMELATLGARYLKKNGFLDDMEVSEENNACSIFVDIDVDGQSEKWLLQFKNETHNHPTEIEPFGGASTCLGGAIRDPLSGRAYVYQAMRVTGAGDIYKPIAETMEGKLPQRIISRKAADGYSSYGNQIGLATTHLREIYHPNYVAKRLEVGAVCGAVKADAVRRESPVAGDIVLMFGGRTGRDGVGGATGSSKEHTTESLESCSSEVQKGNAPEERKISRLFRRPEVTRLVKKSNDFGAGGVSVAIGELTDGLDIYLDRIPTKYSGLNSTEIAISESQERMSVVVEAKDKEEFMRYCAEENLEITHVADVTDLHRMRMFSGEELIVDLRRDFIDSAGAPHYAEALIEAVEERDPFVREVEGEDLKAQILNNLADDNVVSQRGLIEMFDATIGRSTVLMPFGGKTQNSETQVSVQKLPTTGLTNTASVMSHGYNPFLSEWSPYHGAAYAVVEACAKTVAAGARFESMRFSYQEYFERMTGAESWGKPLAALLGALKMQCDLKLPSIGGKDSMSGTFHDINVPPMLMAFGVTTVDAREVISTEFKASGNDLYIFRHTPLGNGMPDTDALAEMWGEVSELISGGAILSGYAVGFGGVAEALAKMSFGNEIGAEIELDSAELFNYNYGSIVVEVAKDAAIESTYAEKLGATVEAKSLKINGVELSLDELWLANTRKFASIYPDSAASDAVARVETPEKECVSYSGEAVESPVAYLPVFPGTNCDYDTAKAFAKAGATVTTSVFCNLTSEMVFSSIEQMVEMIDACQIFVLSGGFSSGDEPDGSGKFI
ncbi:MAG: phosphoribosylformylglycinamidine synthase, partial [Rikenellaceae bacterium]